MGMMPRILTLVQSWRIAGFVFLVLAAYGILPRLQAFACGMGRHPNRRYCATHRSEPGDSRPPQKLHCLATARNGGSGNGRNTGHACQRDRSPRSWGKCNDRASHELDSDICRAAVHDLPHHLHRPGSPLAGPCSLRSNSSSSNPAQHEITSMSRKDFQKSAPGIKTRGLCSQTLGRGEARAPKPAIRNGRVNLRRSSLPSSRCKQRLNPSVLSVDNLLFNPFCSSLIFRTYATIDSTDCLPLRGEVTMRSPSERSRLLFRAGSSSLLPCIAPSSLPCFSSVRTRQDQDRRARENPGCRAHSRSPAAPIASGWRVPRLRSSRRTRTSPQRTLIQPKRPTFP